LTASLIAQCRAGFEVETAQDLARLGAAARVALTTQIRGGSGYVVADVGDDLAPQRWWRALDAAPPMFARSVFVGSGPRRLVEPGTRVRPDRVTPLLSAIDAVRAPAAFRSVWVEYPDTNEGKQLGTLARGLEGRLIAALRERDAIDEGAAHRLHVFLPDGTTAWVGVSEAAGGSAWPMGIPRLRMPHAAPSRSTLKLAEAFMTFLGDDAQELLRPGMRAVDLGAAPGGWTWHLVQRGLRVTAVDNAALKGEIARDPLVTHVREDGLRFRPRRPVDWVTCDIVESPARIARLMGDWMAEGAARHAVFNLKLPMKKRYDEVERCRDIVGQRLARAGVRAGLALRQLYHDREEVTGYLTQVQHAGQPLSDRSRHPNRHHPDTRSSPAPVRYGTSSRKKS
jgi:23S rRNA (cytidine2498-2'-O)-methyltransferase